VKDSGYFERLSIRAVDDEVRIYRPEQNIWTSREIATLVTGVGVLSQPPASVPDLPANPGGRLDTVAGYVGPNLLDVPASFGNSTRLKTVFSMVCFSIDPTYSIMVYDSNFPCGARTVFARPSFLADRQRRECRSMPVTVTFGSPFEAGRCAMAM
jgi:hypothetical protein